MTAAGTAVDSDTGRAGPSPRRRWICAGLVAAVFAIDVWWERALALDGHDGGALAVGVVSFGVVLILTFAGVRAGLLSILITLAGFVGTTLLMAHTQSTALAQVGRRADATIVREGVSGDGRHTNYYYTLKLADGSAIPRRLEIGHALNITRRVEVYYDPRGTLPTQTADNVGDAGTKQTVAYVLLPVAAVLLLIGTVAAPRNRLGRRLTPR